MFKKIGLKETTDDSRRQESDEERQKIPDREEDADLREIAWTIWMEKRGRRF